MVEFNVPDCMKLVFGYVYRIQTNLTNTNANRMRRTLYGFTFLFLCLFSYLYWHQIQATTPKINHKTDRFLLEPQHQHSSSNGIKSIPENESSSIWGWTCVNNHCERRLKKIPTPSSSSSSSSSSASDITQHYRHVTNTNSEQSDSNEIYSLRTCNMICGSTQLWPQPTGPILLNSHPIRISPDQFHLDIVAPNNEVDHLLNEAYKIFKLNINALIPLKIPSVTDINKYILRIKIEQPQVDMKLTTNESYSLSVNYLNGNIRAEIEAQTYFGARHALETLSQLIWWDDLSRALLTLKIISIIDRPKFAYRGLMLDTSRHWFSLASILRTLDAMAASKLNIFHWHISDSQSFPFDAPSVPEMAQTGVFSMLRVYKADDVRAIAKYARVRGIKVVIEVDTPAHAGMGWTWGPSKNLGELALCVGQQPWSLYCGEPPCGQLNPANPNVYKILETIYRDIIELSGETEIFHLGGDEVNLECWGQYFRDNISFATLDLHDLWGNFTLKAINALQKANNNQKLNNIILWSSNLAKNPYLTKFLDPKKIIIQDWNPISWADASYLWNNGYRTILSHVDAWYLDCGFGKWRELGTAACDPYRTWQTVYTHRPWAQLGLPKSKWDLILGGEVCLWSEQVDEYSLDTRLWPRAAAFAERMWSDIPLDIQPDKVKEDIYTRLDTMTERLRTRGIQCEAMWPEWCTHNPGMCL